MCFLFALFATLPGRKCPSGQREILAFQPAWITLVDWIVVAIVVEIRTAGPKSFWILAAPPARGGIIVSSPHVVEVDFGVSLVPLAADEGVLLGTAAGGMAGQPIGTVLVAVGHRARIVQQCLGRILRIELVVLGRATAVGAEQVAVLFSCAGVLVLDVTRAVRFAQQVLEVVEGLPGRAADFLLHSSVVAAVGAGDRRADRLRRRHAVAHIPLVDRQGRAGVFARGVAVGVVLEAGARRVGAFDEQLVGGIVRGGGA